MKPYALIIGIDVSKSVLDICQLQDQDQRWSRIDNAEGAIQSWLATLDLSQTLVVLEATGAYSQRLTYALSKSAAHFCVVNPLQSAAYVKVLGITTKNDQQAARCLALMGKQLDLPLYQPSSDTMLERKQLLKSLQILKKQHAMLRNQIHALEHQVLLAPTALDALRQTQQAVEDNIQRLEAELEQVQEADYEDQFQLLTSVVGIGPVCARALLCATGGLGRFDHAGQLIKFAGIAPASHQSGCSIKTRGVIHRAGHSHLRAVLYMAARSAKRFNHACKQLYERLRAKGKAHKQAMVAVMGKLLRQLFGVFKSGKPFDNHLFWQLQK